MKKALMILVLACSAPALADDASSERARAEQLETAGRFAEAGAAHQSAFEWSWESSSLRAAAADFRKAGRSDRAFLILKLHARMFPDQSAKEVSDQLTALRAALGPAADRLEQMLPR